MPTNATNCRLNSGVNRVVLSAMVNSSKSNVQVSTEPGQLQALMAVAMERNVKSPRRVPCAAFFVHQGYETPPQKMVDSALASGDWDAFFEFISWAQARAQRCVPHWTSRQRRSASAWGRPDRMCVYANYQTLVRRNALVTLPPSLAKRNRCATSGPFSEVTKPDGSVSSYSASTRLARDLC